MSFEDWMFVISFSPIVMIIFCIELVLRFFFPKEEDLKKVEDAVFPKENNS